MRLLSAVVVIAYQIINTRGKWFLQGFLVGGVECVPVFFFVFFLSSVLRNESVTCPK